jgi:hypothetical protein
MWANVQPVEAAGLRAFAAERDWLMTDDPSYRQAAARLRAEMASLPDASAAVRLVERLATTREPVSG